MDYQKACQILELENNKKYKKREIKRIYHRLALKYHPDKNSNTDENADEIFKEVNEAYEYLTRRFEMVDVIEVNLESHESFDISNYRYHFKVYISSLFPAETINHEVLDIIIDQILSRCEKKSMEFIRNFNSDHIIGLYSMLQKYENILPKQPNELLDKIVTLFREKLLKKNTYILDVSIDDLFDQNIYRLQHGSNEYLVPMWISELTYDDNGDEIKVQCIPELPDFVTLDENNVVHLNVRVNLANIFSKNKNGIEIKVGNKIFTVNLEELSIEKNQTLIRKNAGIPAYNDDDLFDVSTISDVHIHIELLED